MLGTEVLELLKKFSRAAEAYHRTEYTLYRERKTGEMQEVRVVILDAGPAAGQLRYHATATDEDGRSATGNPADSAETALAIMHWGNLDR
jgi:hypothetical protein